MTNHTLGEPFNAWVKLSDCRQESITQISLEKHRSVELIAMMVMLYIYAVQCDSHWPYVDIEPLQCGWYNWGIAFLVLFHFDMVKFKIKWSHVVSVILKSIDIDKWFKTFC